MGSSTNKKNGKKRIKSKSKKKVSPTKKKVNTKKLEADLLKEYVKLSKEVSGKELYRDHFVSMSNFTRQDINIIFGNFSKFKQAGESAYRKSIPSSQRALLSEFSKKLDPNATKDDCIEDLRDLYYEKLEDTVGEEVPKGTTLGSISRNYYREHGQYSDSTWNQYFGTFQEFRRQAGLELTRHQHKLERQIAKHASNDHYKKFVDEEYLPHFKKYEKHKTDSDIKKIMIISDLHDRDCCDFTLSTFVSECLRKQPDIIVLNGDIFDLYEFSRYSKDPRHYDILGRFQYVWDHVFGALRKACPDAQIDMVIGNHEFRLLKLLADATPNIRVLMADVMELKLKDVFKLDAYQINLVSKFDLGAFSTKEITAELNKNYQIYYGCYVVCHEPDKNLMIMSGTNGHHHRLDQRSNAFPDPATGKVHQVTWVQTPAGHRKDAEYLQNMCKWNTGFLDVTVNVETKEVVQNIRQTFNTWTEIDGIIYRRKDD